MLGIQRAGTFANMEGREVVVDVEDQYDQVLSNKRQAAKIWSKIRRKPLSSNADHASSHSSSQQHNHRVLVGRESSVVGLLKELKEHDKNDEEAAHGKQQLDNHEVVLGQLVRKESLESVDLNESIDAASCETALSKQTSSKVLWGQTSSRLSGVSFKRRSTSSKRR